MNQAANSETTPPVLAIEGLSKSFHGKPALADVSFEVPPASLVVILGPAGAGKTTTLRMIAGLDVPDEGRVLLSGQDVLGWEPKDRNVAMIFDNLALYPNKSGYANIASPLVIRKESPEVIKERVAAVAKTLQIAHILDRLPKTMSGGERQRIALGRALIRTPNLFLLDEPLSSLDAKLRAELRTELRRMQQEQGYTFLMATPDFNEAMAIADTVVMLQQGRVVQIADPQTLYDDPVDAETARFVGAPEINLLPARSRDGRLDFAGADLPMPGHLAAVFGGTDQDFDLGLRPENLLVADADSAPIRGLLSDVEPLGPKSVLTVSNDHAELRLTVPTAEAREMSLDQAVGLELAEPSRLLAFDPHSGRRLAAD
ncbi:ABC transporter ATP-binding protein [Desulfocurvus sp. DL9XJH121]